MNEHDSERIAGLLAADGYESKRRSDADIVVLNTCCIREMLTTSCTAILALKTWKTRRAARLLWLVVFRKKIVTAFGGELLT